MLDPLSNVQHVVDGPLGLVHRVRIPEGAGPHPTLIMLHGLDGNEDVTWVFARAAGPRWLILTPRAPLTHPTDPSRPSYRWYQLEPDQRPNPTSYQLALTTLERFIEGAKTTYPVDPARIVLLGFSQGAAMAYAYALAHPGALLGLAALSGFIANLNQITIPPLNRLPILILHGSRDETVPVKMAQRARDRLQAAGAQITYEESDIGHKLSAQGTRTLAAWLAERLNSSNK